MNAPDEQTRLCWFCKKKPATAKFTDERGKYAEMVCSTCLDRMEVQVALEETVLRIIELGRQDKANEALALLDELFETNRHRDHDGWLARSVATQRADVLYEAGRYGEALEAYDVGERLGFQNVTYRWAHASAKARTLQALGRHEEALATFEEAFSHQEPRFADGAAYYLPVLAELYEGVGRPVDEKWRDVARMVEEEYGIKMPVRKTLAKSLRVLNKLTGRMKTKRQKEWERKNQGKADDP